MEFYSAIKNEILLFVSKWMKLENIILSKFSHAQKTKATYFLLYVEYRFKSNTSNIMKKAGNTNGRSHTTEGSKRWKRR
jgi:hypothetical protein